MSVGAPQPEDEFLKIMHEFLASQQASIEAATRELRDELIPQFREYRVAEIEAVFSGFGDSGCIDGVQFRDEHGIRVDREGIPTSVRESLDKCLYEFLPAGFEINEGSQGKLTVDTRTCRLTIQHQENYTGTRDSIREFML